MGNRFRDDEIRELNRVLKISRSLDVLQWRSIISHNSPLLSFEGLSTYINFIFSHCSRPQYRYITILSLLLLVKFFEGFSSEFHVFIVFLVSLDHVYSRRMYREGGRPCHATGHARRLPGRCSHTSFQGFHHYLNTASPAAPRWRFETTMQGVVVVPAPPSPAPGMISRSGGRSAASNLQPNVE